MFESTYRYRCVCTDVHPKEKLEKNLTDGTFAQCFICSKSLPSTQILARLHQKTSHVLQTRLHVCFALQQPAVILADHIHCMQIHVECSAVCLTVCVQSSLALENC